MIMEGGSFTTWVLKVMGKVKSMPQLSKSAGLFWCEGWRANIASETDCEFMA